ncbi:MAG: hypothetical protein PHW69_07775 [Elusimicrobiaceae bacterium]|nr:hypothetical protein [Elusimicrobiaceae bacterium]
MSDLPRPRNAAPVFSVYFWVLLPLAGGIIWLVLNYLLPETVSVRRPETGLFLSNAVKALKPEPLESAGYLFMIFFVPVFYLAAFLLLRAFRFQNLPDPVRKRLWQVALLVQGGCLYLVFQNLFFQNIYVRRYFASSTELPALLAGLAGAGLTAAAACRPRAVRERLARLKTGVPAAWAAAARYAAVSAGAAALVAGLLPSFFTSRNFGNAFINVLVHLPFTMGEFAAVLNGRSPGVDFFPQYQNLLGYFMWPYFKLCGLGITSYTAAMVLLSAAGMALVWRMLVKVSGGLGKGTLLFLIFAGLSFYAPNIKELQRFYIFNYYAVAPIRYLALWLTGFFLLSYLEKNTRTRLFVLFGAAGLCVVNNPDFGVPAFVAACAACLVPETEGRLLASRRGMAEAAVAAGTGLMLGWLVFAALSLVHCGRLPDLSAMTQYQRMFVVNGFMALPAPPMGLHWLLLATFLGSLFAGCVPSRESRALRGLLVFAGISGCGIGMYYVGRSHSTVLNAVFPAWGVALALLLLFLARVLARAEERDCRRLAHAAPVFFLLYFSTLSVLALGTLNNPLKQYGRFAGEDSGYMPAVAKLGSFIGSFVSPGEKVLIICQNAHLLALLSGSDNVFPYASSGSLILKSQAELVVSAARKNGVRKVFGKPPVELIELLEADGFVKTVGLNAIGFYVWERGGV